MSLFRYKLNDSLIYKYAKTTRKNGLDAPVIQIASILYVQNIIKTVFRYVLSSRIYILHEIASVKCCGHQLLLFWLNKLGEEVAAFNGAMVNFNNHFMTTYSYCSPRASIFLYKKQMPFSALYVTVYLRQYFTQWQETMLSQGDLHFTI